MNCYRIRRLLAFCLLAAFGTLTQAAPVLSFASYDLSGTANPSVRGWQFGVLAADGIDVSALGVFDYLGDGLANFHEVGLWTSGGTLLATALVPAGSAARLDSNGLFRVVDIAPVHLMQGSEYVIAAVYDPFPLDDWQAVYATDYAVAPSINYEMPRYLSEALPTLAFPTTTVGIGPGIFGASFEVVGQVPETTSLSLVLIGIFGLLVTNQRKRRDRDSEPPFQAN